MKTYAVISHASGAEVYRYEADAPIEWGGFEFATHDHIDVTQEAPAPPVPPVYEWERLVFMRRFTALERITAREAEKADPVMADFFDLLRQAPAIHSNDPDVILGLGYMVQQGHLTAARRDAILGIAA